MKDTKLCEVCGSPVRVVGHTTKHYVSAFPTAEELQADIDLAFARGYKAGCDEALQIDIGYIRNSSPNLEIRESSPGLWSAHFAAGERAIGFGFEADKCEAEFKAELIAKGIVYGLELRANMKRLRKRGGMNDEA